MTPEEKKDFFKSKLNNQPKPVMTQVVPVDPESTKPVKKTKKAAVESERDYTNKDLDHFNVYVPKEAGKALRRLRVDQDRTVTDMLSEAVMDFLVKMGVKL